MRAAPALRLLDLPPWPSYYGRRAAPPPREEDLVRLCLIDSAREWGGAERVLAELAEGFLAAGHEVDFVCRPGTPMSAAIPAGASGHPMAFRGDLDVATGIALHRLLRRRRPTAVLCLFGRECWLAGWAAAPLGIPLVHVKATADQRLGGRTRFLYRHLVARVVCCSQAVRDGFRGLDVPEDLFRVIPNGVDVRSPSPPAAVAARARSGARAADFLVAYSGRLHRDKGVDLLPAVLGELLTAGVPARIVVVGEGALRGSLEDGFAAAGLAGRVHFAGFVGDPLPFVTAAQAAVIPSRCTEAFGLVAVEALAVGTPVVASRIGGLAEILADGETGLLVPPGDAAAMARALERLWREPALGEALRRHGRARAAEYTRQRMVDAYLAVVRELGSG
jgi:glycosyltransferase involved in cell wall biosynthesis